MQESQLPASLSLKCQATAYQLLEDMRFLYEHPLVESAADSSLRFLELVNRKFTDNEGDPCEIQSSIGLHTRFLLGNRDQLIKVHDEAINLLEIYQRPDLLPPPLWLRLLPMCCSIALDNDLFDSQMLPHLKWLAFNIDVKDIGTSSEASSTVNINSNETKENIELVEGATPLSRILYDYLHSQPQSSMPYIFWGIRFRTATAQQKRPGHWIDISANMNNSNAVGDDNVPDLVSAVVRPPTKPFPADASRTSYIDDLFRKWAGIDEGGDLSSATKELSAYCRTLQKFYSAGKWPAGGIDSLLCPSLLWSPEPEVLGAGATIFWGFEGSLSNEQCCQLLWLTQMLVSGAGQFVNTAKTLERSQRRGRDDVLHHLPHDYAALRDDVEEFRRNLTKFAGEHSDLNIPQLPRTDRMGISIMCLKAQNQRILEPLPEDCAALLLEKWTAEKITEFVSEVVWPYVLHRCLTDPELKRHAITREKIRQSRPVIDIAPEEFSLLNSEVGIYPLILFSLRNAMQHSVIHSCLTKTAGQLRIEYSGTDVGATESVTVFNNGDCLSGGESRRQSGWLKDLRIFKGLTGHWRVVARGSQYSTFDENRGLWKTEICWTREESNG